MKFQIGDWYIRRLKDATHRRKVTSVFRSGEYDGERRSFKTLLIVFDKDTDVVLRRAVGEMMYTNYIAEHYVQITDECEIAMLELLLL